MNWLNKLDDVLDAALRPAPPTTATTDRSSGTSSRKQPQQPPPEQCDLTTAAAAAAETPPPPAVGAAQQQPTPWSQGRAATAAVVVVGNKISSTPGRLKRGPTHQSTAAKTKRVVVGPSARIALSSATTTVAAASASLHHIGENAALAPPQQQQQQQHQQQQQITGVVPDDRPLLQISNETGESSTTVLKTSSSFLTETKEQLSGVVAVDDANSTIMHPRTTTTTTTTAETPSPMTAAGVSTATTTTAAAPRGAGIGITPGLVRKKKKPPTSSKQVSSPPPHTYHSSSSSLSSPSLLVTTPAFVQNTNIDGSLNDFSGFSDENVLSRNSQQQHADSVGTTAAPASAASTQMYMEQPITQQQTAVSSVVSSRHGTEHGNASHEFMPRGSEENGLGDNTTMTIPPCDAGRTAGSDQHAMAVVLKTSSSSISSSIESSSAVINAALPQEFLAAAATNHLQEQEENFNGEEEHEGDTSFVSIPLSGGCGPFSPKTGSFVSTHEEEEEEPDYHTNDKSEGRNHHDSSSLLLASDAGGCIGGRRKSPIVSDQTGKDEQKGSSNPLIGQLKNPSEHANETSINLKVKRPRSTQDGNHHESEPAELVVTRNEQLSAIPTAARQIQEVQEDRIFKASSKSRDSYASSTLAVVVDEPVTMDNHPHIRTAEVGEQLTQNRDPLLVGIESTRASRRSSLERTPSNVMRADDLSSVSGVDSSFPLFRSDFEVDRLLSTWDDESHQPHFPPWDPRMNCYGVVHVRVLRAQRLPCPVGSSIHAVVSLPPWKGMVRTRRAKAFAGSGRKRGVCIDWTETETCAISMVHAYSSNEESPVPSIHVDLMMSTMGMFEFKISSLTLPCETLLQSPLVPRRNWFLTSVPPDSPDRKHVPLLQIEALFEPDEKNLPSPSPSSTTIPMDIVAYGSSHGLSASLREGADGPPVSESPSQASAVSTNLDDVLQGGDDLNSSQQASVDVARSGPTPEDYGAQQYFNASGHTESIQGQSIATTANSVAKPTEAVSLVPANAILGDDQSMADLTVSLHSLRRQESLASSANAHLLRLQTYYKPATCAVCKRSIMSVWRKKAYHCEVCGVDCCSDCRLHIDVQLVCGSEEARRAVEHAIQSKFTADKILRLVAPIDESESEHALDLSTSSNHKPLGDHKEAGIGVVKIDVLQAIVLANPLPADSDAVDAADCLRSGDFYVRVSRSGTERNARTRTVQNSSGRPKFDAEEIRLSVPDYATEFRIEVVDASTDQPIGATLLTTQALLQEQRDLMGEGRLGPSSFGPFSFRGKRWIKTELRTGLKTGFGADFFPDVKQAASATGPQAGDIVGMIELAVGLEEDFEALYGKSPYECPPRPSGELDLSVIQGHIVRLSYLVNDMKSVVNTYVYIISWANPFVTALSLVLFVRFCFWYDPAHTGASSIFLLLVYMVYLAVIRFHGSIKRRFVERELSLYKKRAKVEQAQHALHRPVGLIQASVLRGKNLRSPELGLPGNAGCHVYLDLTRFMDSVEAKELELLDESVAAPHELGSTEHVYAMNPTWAQLAESDEARRLRQLLPTHGGFFEVLSSNRGEDELLEFPVLQPFDHTSQNSLIPWSASAAAVVFEVKLHDVLKVLPGSEYSLGEVVVPLRTLAEKNEISGWFKLTESGISEHFAAPTKADLELDMDAPQVLLHLRWVPPQSVPQLPRETEREASVVIQEELVKSATLNRQSKLGVVGSSIGAINSMRALTGHLLVVQNALGMVLDAIESIRNGFNFADPFKSSVLFAILSLLCLVLTIVPTRVILLSVVMLQYLVTFKARFGRLFKMGRNEPTVKTLDHSKDNAKSPVVTWVMNAIRGLPTDVDLKRTYHWETRRLVAREVESQAEQKRTSRLRRLWRAQWYATVELVKMRGASQELTPVFAMIQGHRFLWWRSVQDFDQGADILGRIFLQGHAGLASPSPLELKAVRKEDLARLVGIFGRGADRQERLTLLCSSVEERDNFEKAISKALTTKND